MLEITGNDISELNDSDLRSLIGLLCEAELRANGLPIAGITWGGHQDAKDGGIDVRVELTCALYPDGFIPRAKTGFQVKKPDMPASAITSEMCPDGGLRKAIKDLADVGGAYIIVSGQGSTTDSALLDRKNAIKDALSDYPNAGKIIIDFYDRERVAGWVRSHPSLILWVRDKIGKSIQGWQPYRNWSNTKGGIEEEYLIDEEIRLYNGTEQLSILNGITELREMLCHPASSVRLVGLSGVGKTRLLQVLFDERIGEKALNPSQVFYADIGDSPNPDSLNFAERIIASGIPAIIAIDNCPPELHRRLTTVCSASGSLVSLITVEYDIREDQPEETEVFRLEPASKGLVEKMILARFRHISQVNARTIAEFSGGNAKIAIALVNTVKKDENLANLKDDDLFKRLFHQRNDPNYSLLRSAEVCALVYSFDCQTAKDLDFELRLLGSLAHKSVSELFADVSELKRRGLVQQRSIWRAVLPQAIANRLAQRALENIPDDDILNVFEKSGSKRMLKSFSRRLSYIHESEIAKTIADRWLSKDGLLNDISNLNDLGINLLVNAAPIKPESILSAIERAATNTEEGQKFVSRANPRYIEFTRLLRSLAYDKTLFERSTDLLCCFALSEHPNENRNSIRDLLKSLFYIWLSGTQALAEQRLDVIRKLINSNHEGKQNLALLLLKSALKAEYFNSYNDFEFGARSRDYGFWPKTREEVHHWFNLYINFSLELVLSEQPISIKVKAILAEKFRELWMRGMFDELEDAAKKIANKGSWNDGWIAVRTTLRLIGEKMEPEIRSRLVSLDTLLKATNLIQRARLYALSGHNSAIDLVYCIESFDKKISDNYSRVLEITRSIGQEVASKEDNFKELLPDILSTDGGRLYTFGLGLSDGCTQPLKMWQDFYVQLSSMEQSKRHYQVLQGFLNATSLKNPTLSEKILDNAVTDSILASIYPVLQTSVKINNPGVERLKQSLEYGVAPIWQYRSLAYESISDKDLSDLLRIIALKPDGLVVATEILSMRLHKNPDETLSISDVIISLGQDLLLKMRFSRKDEHPNNIDYGLGKIIEACFDSDVAKDSAKALCINMSKSFASYEIYHMDYRNVLEALATKQPLAFLDGFLDNGSEDDDWIEEVFSEEENGNRTNPISRIDDNLVIDWCEANPKVRYPVIAQAISSYRNREGAEVLEWTPISLKIIANSPDPIIIMNILKSKFKPMSRSGSRAEIMQKRLSLISDLKNHENPLVSEWACNEEIEFKEEIMSERRFETEHEDRRNERFE